MRKVRFATNVRLKTAAVGENNQKLALVNCQLEANNVMLETANQTLSETLAQQTPHIAVLPEDDDLKPQKLQPIREEKA